MPRHFAFRFDSARYERAHPLRLPRWSRIGLACAIAVVLVGCVGPPRPAARQREIAVPSCDPAHLAIKSPPEVTDACDHEEEFIAGPPITLTNFEQIEPWPLALEEAVRITLSNSKVLQRIGGLIVASPQGAGTVFDPALQATSPFGSEAALAAFDAQYAGLFNHGHDEQFVNNPFFGSGNTYNGLLSSQVSKTTATGTQFSLRNATNYNRNPSDFFEIDSAWTVDILAEVRQPLLRNAGLMVNRIAGPNAVPGQYNGVLIGRIREDISLADFEANVRDLVRDVVIAYWELYFAYQDLDTKLAAREAARLVWQTRKVRRDIGEDRPDQEALARQQYYQFQFEVESALIGNANRLGVAGAERNLRRLMGIAAADGRLIRPATEPTRAQVLFDWQAAQRSALERRVELRRQKWIVRQRELELCAAKNLAQWRVDLVGNYGARGFGDDLFGTSAIPADGALEELFGGELDNWQFGLEILGPFGNRAGHLAVRNAQLGLCRDTSVLREMQRQILLDLGAAYAEVDRSFVAIKTLYNNLDAVRKEVETRETLLEGGEEEVFFVAEARQRATIIESGMHRSIVDYNLALLRFAFANGTLLSQFNIDLAEESWCNPDRVMSEFENQPIENQIAPSDPAAMSSFGGVGDARPNAEAESPAPISSLTDERQIITIPSLSESN
jgi:outer membrane protein TolC